MYRYGCHIEAKLGEWREFMSLSRRAQQRDAGRRSRAVSALGGRAGGFDEAFLVADHESLDHDEREHDSVHSDVGCMTTWREMCAHMHGVPWTDLWWTPSKAG